MKKLSLLMLVLLLTYTIHAQPPAIVQQQHIDASGSLPLPTDDKDMVFEVYHPARQHSKIKCLLLTVGNSEQIEKIAPLVKFDLGFSDQLDLDIKRTKGYLDQKILTKLFEKEISLCLYLAEKPAIKTNTINVHVLLKDTASGETFFEKNFSISPHAFTYHVHTIADEIMPVLTGEKGPMLSTLAYCKQISSNHKVVCIADYACLFEKVVVPARTINVAPAWHSQAPVLFYSQFTKYNSRLMSYDLQHKNHKIICSYDGINMQPSFSPNGTKAALCLSGGGNSEIYLYDQAICNKLKKRVFKPLTKNHGNNVSPCYLPDGNLIFCSDFQSKYPQIYHLNTVTHKTTRLTNGRGYCAAPSYCAKNNSIVYTRYIKGVFQLFTIGLNEKNHKERQLTFTHGEKLDPSWSECGNYVAFTYNFIEHKKRSNQIAVLNLTSGKIRVLTSGKEPKSFPAWTNRALYQA
jgi:tol-pal system beta propeller repeat protein TolB